MRVRVAHASLQFSDTDKQHTADIEKIFDRAVDRRYAWITGTESGPGAGNTGRELIRVAREHNYRPWVPQHQGKGISQHTDCWIAVREDLIKGDWTRGYEHVIDGSAQMKDEIDIPEGKKWGPKGLVYVGFDSLPELGHINVGAAHYLTDARNPDSQFWDLNERLGREVVSWARAMGKGSSLVFYGGDQNMRDDKNEQPQGDTFFGGPLTSTWDQLRTWENTGHGTIDVIATYNKDHRVKAMATQALDDTEFFLHGDHFFVEAVLRVDPLKR